VAREAAGLIARIKRYRSGQILTPLIDQYLREQSTKDGVQFSPETMQLLAKLHLRKPRYRGGSFSCSSLASCMRAQMLNYLDYEQIVLPNEAREAIFFNGNWLHLKWQGILIEMGVVARGPTGVPMVEQRVSLPNQNVEGTLDAICNLNHPTQWIVDIKGVGPGYWTKMKEGWIPEVYIWQQHAYMMATGIPNAMLLVESKATQEYLELHIPPLTDSSALQVQARIAALNKFIDLQELPPMLKHYPRDPQCKQCPFMLDCPKAVYREVIPL